jgi:glycosyltransferase involved in cell wall biosynthesis
MKATDQQFELSLTRPLQVCIVAPSLEIYGGQSIQAARLLEGLNRQMDIEAAFLPHNPRLPGPLRKLQAIKYVRTVFTELAYVFLLLSRLWKYDVIHVFSASYYSFLLAPAPAILIARLYGKPVILNYHSGEAEDHLRNWRSAIPIIRLATRVIVPSRYLVDVFQRFGIVAEAIFNTVELDKFTFRERKPLRPVIVSNRNLEAHYGVADTLRAFAKIERESPDVRLIVAGDGSQRGMLHSLASELGLKRVEFVGSVPPEQMPRLLDSADIFINASVVDNMPLSIIEAFASGLPVVTTGAGGIPYIVSHGRNGMVVAPGDSDALADAVLSLLRDEALAQHLIDNAQSDSIFYTWESVKSGWLEAYRELVN